MESKRLHQPLYLILTWVSGRQGSQHWVLSRGSTTKLASHIFRKLHKDNALLISTAPASTMSTINRSKHIRTLENWESHLSEAALWEPWGDVLGTESDHFDVDVDEQRTQASGNASHQHMDWQLPEIVPVALVELGNVIIKQAQVALQAKPAGTRIQLLIKRDFPVGACLGHCTSKDSAQAMELVLKFWAGQPSLSLLHYISIQIYLIEGGLLEFYGIGML